MLNKKLFQSSLISDHLINTVVNQYNTAVKQHNTVFATVYCIGEWGTCQSRSFLWSRQAPASRRQRYSLKNVRGRRLWAARHSELRATPPNRRCRTLEFHF